MTGNELTVGDGNFTTTTLAPTPKLRWRHSENSGISIRLAVTEPGGRAYADSFTLQQCWQGTRQYYEGTMHRTELFEEWRDIEIAEEPKTEKNG